MSGNLYEGKNMLTVGTILRDRREYLGVTIEDVISHTKLKKEIIEEIEADRLSQFDNQVFLTGYLKIYAQYLGLKTDRVLAIYRRSTNNPTQEVNTQGDYQQIKRKEKFNWKNLVAPRYLIGLASILLLSVIGYFLYIQISAFYSPPLLEITNAPTDRSTVNSDIITIAGKTDDNSIVTIKNVQLELSETNTFNSRLQLTPGENRIMIKASKQSNSVNSTQEIFTIFYQPIEEEPEVIEPSIDENTQFSGNVELLLDSTIEIVADEEKLDTETLIVGDIVDFSFKNSLRITSDTLNSLSATIDEQEFQLIRDTVTQELVLVCEVNESVLTCQDGEQSSN